jgi:PilZ domain
MRAEKRRHRRYSVTCELTGKSLKPIAGPEAGEWSGGDIRGVIPDVSAGGLCLLTDDRAEVSDPLVCEIRGPDMPVAIPTLMQVRWFHKHGDGYAYRLGLQFLF